MPKKYISYDYLYSRRELFPYTYRLVFEKILADAPAEEDRYMQGYNDGYESGLLSAEGGEITNSFPEARR